MPANANLYAAFQQCFPSDLDSPLLFTETGELVSYADTDTASARLGNALLSLGASPGDRVSVQVDKSVENLFLYLACLRSGLVYHPLNPAYTESELAYFLADAQPTVVVCDDSSFANMERALSGDNIRVGASGVRALLTLGDSAEGGAPGTLMHQASRADSELNPANSDGTDVAALLYSSGTTGKPKGIPLSHDNLRSNANTLVGAWGFTSADRLLHALPIYHVHGLFVALGCVLMSGSSMVWHARFSDATAIAAMPECTVMMGVPTYYTRLLGNSQFGRECASHMRLFVSGSAPLLKETFIEFCERSGHTILERYGMTETGMNTTNPLRGERRAGTVGAALPGVNLRVLDDEGRPLECDLPGNLQVKGPNVFAGYWRMPAKTAEDFTADGFFNTGDKASIDKDGYVSIVGRAKDMIISGGLNVYPKEIELVIDELEGVVESAVIGVPHADFGEAVVAVIVTATLPSTPLEVMEHCRRKLAGFKLPKRIEVLEALPRNAMGKVQKNRLREQYADACLH
ncbi:MAG: AMP-binding protein [Congregibacter sp.]